MRKISFGKLAFFVSIIVFNFALAQAQTSVFTYQGKLTDLNAAANGQYDFTFKLFDAASGGTQIGADNFLDDVPVSGGIFTVSLNFGASAFTNGAARFLEISVRAGSSTGAFVVLVPRQEVTSAPFSIKTINAANADSLSNSCVLCVTDGQIQSIDGSKITGTVANATTAASVSGIVPIANGGTGSSTKNFVDLSSNQNISGAKTFNNPVTIRDSLNVDFNVTADQFFGDGAGLTNVYGKMRWLAVSGLTQQAQPDTGYLATNNAQVTITLPVSIGIGEIVRVSGIGAGGWKIAQNAGQSIIGTNIGLIGANWTPRDSNRGWIAVASSADGTKLVAAAQNGQIYTSTDSGATWTPRESNRYWTSVASSADGTKLVAVADGAQIYTSGDSGLTWTPRESNRGWLAVASSADGTKLVAAVYLGQIYTSDDSGVSWTARETNRQWSGVASSADGTKLAALDYNGRIYTSTNSGVNWTPRENSRFWHAIASSADGTKLAAVVFGGQIFTSTNSGATWTSTASSQEWWSVASSADGTKLVAAAQNGQIYSSTDSGATWTARENLRLWRGVASSANGEKLAATVYNGQIYTSLARTSVGTTGYLTGEQYSSIELQYIGSELFLPLSHSGTILGF